MTKSVAELQEALRVAQAQEAEAARKAEEARKARAVRVAQRDALIKEIDQRQLQIDNTVSWLKERAADADALRERVKTEFEDLDTPVEAAAA